MRPGSLHARDWEEMAALDPLWAILSSPEKRFGNWELQEFLRTGQEEISNLMQSAQRFGLPVQRRRAIDYGCGIGRLTKPLKTYFEESYGVDIAQGMLEKAAKLAPECQFRCASDLGSFPSRHADLIYSTLVLQHQPRRKKAAALISDMVRVLAPGGLLVFQLPIHLPLRNRLQLRRRAYRLLRGLGIPHSFLYEKLKLNPIRMIALPEKTVDEIVRSAGGKVVHIERTTNPGDPFISGIYYCTVATG
jgi:SAM-dependent methyltransferase